MIQTNDPGPQPDNKSKGKKIAMWVICASVQLRVNRREEK